MIRYEYGRPLSQFAGFLGATAAFAGTAAFGLALPEEQASDRGATILACQEAIGQASHLPSGLMVYIPEPCDVDPVDEQFLQVPVGGTYLYAAPEPTDLDGLRLDADQLAADRRQKIIGWGMVGGMLGLAGMLLESRTTRRYIWQLMNPPEQQNSGSSGDDDPPDSHWADHVK